jgi:hypothetical protein
LGETPETRTKIGTAQDWRGHPASETMKPWDLSKAQGKQSAISLSIMTERLPSMEPITAPARMPGRMSLPQSLVLMQVPRPTFEMGDMTTMALMQVPKPKIEMENINVMTILSTRTKREDQLFAVPMAMGVFYGQRQQQIQQQAIGLGFGQTLKQSQESLRREAIITDQFTGTKRRTDVITIPLIIQTPARTTTTGQRTEQRTRLDRITDITRVPSVTRFPWLDWGGGSNWPVMRRRGKVPFQEVIPVKSQLFGGRSILKGISKKKKYVEVGKEYKTVVSGRKTRVKHISKTGR